MSAVLPVSELPFDLASASVPHIITELPGPEARRMIERDQRVASPSMGRVYPLVPKRGAGLVIEDVDGNRFLDFNAGIAVTSTGHCHPRVTAAIEQQARTLLHYCSSDWYHPVYVELCERLAAGATTGAWPGVQPFGGWKGSGTNGKAGGGPYYVQQYLREQSRTVVSA